MTPDEFYNGDPEWARAYALAEEYRLERENSSMHLQGLYNYNAFGSVMNSFAYGMNGGKGRKPQGYIEHPIPITEREKKAEEARKIKHTVEFFTKGQE